MIPRSLFHQIAPHFRTIARVPRCADDRSRRSVARVWRGIGGVCPVTLVLAFLGLLGNPAFAEDWPCWRGPDLNGISRETGWKGVCGKNGPSQVWKASVGIGFSSVSVVDGRLFTMGNKDGTDTVWCLDAETGGEVWSHSYRCELDPIYYEGGPGATPTVDGDRVYTLSKRGHLFSFQAVDGEILWMQNLTNTTAATKPRWGFAGSPLVHGDRLILNAGESGAAVDKLSGQVLWHSGTNAGGYATPVPYTMNGSACAAIFSGKALFGVRLSDGQPLWKQDWTTKWDINAADPIVNGDRAFVSTFDRGGALVEFGPNETRVVWETKRMGNHFNSCVELDGYFYGIDGNTDEALKEFRCLDVATGEVKWSYKGLGLGSVTAADGKLIVMSEMGELLVLEATPERFRPLSRVQVMGGKCWTVPVLANGRIYCRNAAGTLICLDVRGSDR